MQPHSILHSLIQTYHEYLLEGNFSALEIPRVRRLVNSNQPSSSPSFELYFEILNDNDALGKQRNHNVATKNFIRNICVDFLNSYIGDIPPYLPLQTYLHHIAFLIPDYELEAFPLLCETLEEGTLLTVEKWLEKSNIAIKKNAQRRSKNMHVIGSLFENVDSEETQQLENTIDDELSLEDISLEDALTNTEDNNESSEVQQGEENDNTIEITKDNNDLQSLELNEEIEKTWEPEMESHMIGQNANDTDEKKSEEKIESQRTEEIPTENEVEELQLQDLEDNSEESFDSESDFDDDITIKNISQQSNPNVIWKVGFDTHIGVRKAWVSQTNQDCFFFDRHENSAILLVADGISISSAGSGDIASNITAQTVAHFWTECKETLLSQEPSDIREFLLRTLIHANQEICRIAQEFVEDITSEVPMGTTVLLAYCRGNDVWLANLGDSRAYVVMDNGLGLLVGDQNLLGEKLRHHIPLEINDNFKALIRYLGHFDAEWKPALQMPDIRHVRLMDGEGLLLCSDGLTDYASDTHYGFQQLAVPILQDENKTLFEKAYQLTALANIRGGGDNITVMLAMPESTKGYTQF